MPEWARPDPAEIETTEAVDEDSASKSAGEDVQQPLAGNRRVIASMPVQEKKKPESVDELRAAMNEILSAPAPASPTKKERSQARQAKRAARADGEVELLGDDQWREKARGIVLRQLTASDKTAKQLKDKLLAQECPEDIADEVIERYAQINLVDDERFATTWVTARARSKGLARGAIKRELRTKGIDDETAAQALEQIDDESEEQRARELVRTKLRPESMGVDRDRSLRRLVGMLGRKGYNGGMAFRVAREEWDARFGQHD